MEDKLIDDSQEKPVEQAVLTDELIKKGEKYGNMFRKAFELQPKRQQEYAELVAFYEGSQNLLTSYKVAKPWVVDMNTPYATVAIDNRISSLIASDYVGQLEPLSPDDEPAINKLQRLLESEWNRMDLNEKISECIEKGAVVRESYIHLIFDKDKVYGGTNRKMTGLLDAYVLDPGCVYIDPKALNLRDARYCCVPERKSKEELTEQYPEYADIINSRSKTMVSVDERGEFYLNNDYQTNQEDIITKITFYEKSRNRIIRTVMIEDIIVYQKPMKLSMFPILQFRWKKRMKSPYAISLMDGLLSLQKSTNSIESAITNTALTYAAPGYMVRKGSGIDPKKVAKASGAPGVVYEVLGDLTNAMKPITNPSIDDRIVNIKNDNRNMINEIAGNTQQFQGNLGSAGNTNGGAKQAIERAKVVENSVLKNIQVFVEDITRCIIEFISIAYDDSKVYIRNKKSSVGKFSFDEIKIDAGEFADLEYTFYINLNVKTPYAKDREKETILELFTIEHQYDNAIKLITPLDILQTLDVENKDELIDRYTQLSKSDDQSKANIINSFTQLCYDNGVDPNLIQQGIIELMNNDEKQETVNEIIQQISQAKQQQAAQMQASEDKMVSENAPSPEAYQMAEQVMNQQ